MGVRAPLTIAISGNEFGINRPSGRVSKRTSLSAAGRGGNRQALVAKASLFFELNRAGTTFDAGATAGRIGKLRVDVVAVFGTARRTSHGVFLGAGSSFGIQRRLAVGSDGAVNLQGPGFAFFAMQTVEHAIGHSAVELIRVTQ